MSVYRTIGPLVIRTEQIGCRVIRVNAERWKLTGMLSYLVRRGVNNVFSNEVCFFSAELLIFIVKLNV